jgi:UDP-2,4-diacetamido-2,4,6-trideoxy-beta-L-altropyranose hydrolase
MNLIIRTDASVAIGSGHAMRCLALAQAWRDVGGECIFMMAQFTPAVMRRLHGEKAETSEITVEPGSAEDARRTAGLARERDASWIAVDGYHFGVEYQRTLRDAGRKILLIDDQGNTEHYIADIVLNQNSHACEAMYAARDPHTTLLLGSRYSMLRREFKAWQGSKRDVAGSARKVLVTMGGSDPDNVTSLVIRALGLVRNELEVQIVAGGSNSHIAELERTISGTNARIQLWRDVSNMAELMAWADVAISGAGATCWEMCLLGLPAVLIDIAENQRPIAEDLDKKGVAIHAGSGREISAEQLAKKIEELLATADLRATMSQRGRELVDGHGAQRVVAAMRGDALHLRRTEREDCRILWEWANDHESRRNSFSSDQIAWEEHVQWFHSKLSDPDCVLFTATNDQNMPLGHVRYDLRKLRAVVAINMAPKFRGNGFGKRVLRMATQELFASSRANAVDAYVKPDNECSMHLFSGAGFEREQDCVVAGQQAAHLVLKRNLQ